LEYIDSIRKKISMKFPESFFFGTSTASAQIETASAHQWKGLLSKDGHLFTDTTFHEKQRLEDAELISTLGSVYRCGVDWAALQASPYATFDEKLVKEYQDFFYYLNNKGVKIMFVLHHFAHPIWFEDKDGWTNKNNIPAFIDYTIQCIKNFGPYVSYWNTFNEPNVLALNGYHLGTFPPYRKFRLDLALRSTKIMGLAHQEAYKLIKKNYSNHPIGISHNTAWFHGLSLLGKLSAGFTDWIYLDRMVRHFYPLDFYGYSYYTYMPFKPTPISEQDNPGVLAKMGIPHDKMWGYKPGGISRMGRRFWEKHKIPLLITENGICTEDDELRIKAIKDYLKEIHQMMQDGIPFLGYIHWSPWDNFEWALGPTYPFGLYRTSPQTNERIHTKSVDFWKELVIKKEI
jgi:beta-glucosidase